MNSVLGGRPGENAERPHLEWEHLITAVISPIHFSERPEGKGPELGENEKEREIHQTSQLS